MTLLPLIALGALFTLVGAQVDLSDINAYEENLELWTAVKPSNYKYQSQKQSLDFLQSQLMDVEVFDGVVTKYTFAELPQGEDSFGFFDPGDPAPDYFGNPGIDELFSEIRRAINDRSTFDLDASYDIIFGFPSSVFIDPDELTVDEEIRVDITNFGELAEVDPKTLPYLQNVALWQSFGPMLNYKFQYQEARFDRAEYVQLMDVKVRNGIVIDVAYAETTDFANAGDPAPEDYSAPTIDGLLGFIAKTLDPESQADDPFQYRFEVCNVTYHSTLGYPNYIFTDQFIGAADDEVARTVSNLQGVNAGLSVVGDQPQPLMSGDVQIGIVFTEVLGDNVEVTIDLERVGSACCLKETHICNYPMERVFTETGACDRVTRYSMKMSEMHSFVCDDGGDSFQLDGHVTILCNVPLEGADPLPEGSELCYGAMYWINFRCS